MNIKYITQKHIQAVHNQTNQSGNWSNNLARILRQYNICQYNCQYKKPPKTNYGTGSYPPFENGLHLKILHPANKEPLNAPYF